MAPDPSRTPTISAPSLVGVAWRKSSRSGDQGACVEMATPPGAVAVRDSKDPAGPALLFSTAAWRRFTGELPGAGSAGTGRLTAR